MQRLEGSIEDLVTLVKQGGIRLIFMDTTRAEAPDVSNLLPGIRICPITDLFSYVRAVGILGFDPRRFVEQRNARPLILQTNFKEASRGFGAVSKQAVEQISTGVANLREACDLVFELCE